MTDLVDSVAEIYPINLDDMVEEMKSPSTIRMPEASKRNQAALTALLSEDPSQLVQNYQAIQREAEQGIEFTRKSILSKAQQKQSVSDKQGMMSILSDPNIDIETKRAALAGLNSEASMSTPALVISAAAASPSKNESREAESVRISGVEQWNVINGAKEEKQQLINRSYALASSSAASLTGEVVEKDLAPFSINKAGFGIYNKILKILGKDEAPMLTALMPGTSIKQIRDRLEALPPDEQKKKVKEIADLVQNDPRIIWTKDAQYIKAQLLDQLIGGQEYGTASAWIDNTIGVLDVFGVTGLAKPLVKKLSSKFIKSEAQVAKDIDLRAPTADIAPMSPIKLIEDVNPGKAQAMYAAVAKSEGDDVAQALTGTTRDKALAEPMLPQVLTRQGNIESKIPMPDAEIISEVTDTSLRRFTELEQERIKEYFAAKVGGIKGITPHDNMIATGLVGDRQILKATFGTPKGGFLLPEEAIAQTKFSLARFGVDDSDITLLKKEGDEYIPTTLAETAGKEGSYLVQVDSNSPVRTSDLGGLFDNLDTKRNFFDRMPWVPGFKDPKSGSFMSHIMPAATMVHKAITGPASTATGKGVRLEKQLLKMHDKFAKDIRKFDSERRHSILEYINQANYHRFEEDTATLLGRGFVKEEIEALQQFRKNWDTHFWLENRDANISLANQGYQKFINNVGDSYIAKPLGRNPFYAPVQVIDPATNTLRVVEKLERDTLYDAGGTLAKLRNPVEIEGKYIEHVLVRNTPDEYLRVLNENDQVLNYLKGYHTVEYKNGRQFIDEKIQVDGVERTITREIAGSSEEASLMIKRLARQEGKDEGVFSYRLDRNEMNVGSDSYWELGQQHGRLAQRRRGERLERDQLPINTMDSQFIMNPMEAAARASASISRRVSMRDLLDTAKERAMTQWKPFFQSDGIGGVKWSDVDGLKATNTPYDKEMASARTTVHHLNYLEHGYQNAPEMGFKMLMNTIANVLKSFPTAEKAFMWLGDSKPLSNLKSGGMTAYLSGAPVRQLLIQYHQFSRILGYHPTYLFGPYAADLSRMAHAHAFGPQVLKTVEDKALYDMLTKSGIIDAVDRHNLVRGLLVDMETSAIRGVKMAGNLASIPRRVGFDLGEKGQKIGTTMAVFRKFQKEGKNVLDPNVRDEILEITDGFTYGMTSAGDMPYNQNGLGLIFQFAQATHKAFTTVFDRRIPFPNRMIMAGTDILLFGVPGVALVSKLFGEDVMPKDPVQREAIAHGAVSITYNKALSMIAGKDIDADFSSLSPFGLEGISKLLYGMVKGNFAEAFTNTPAYSLYVKDGGRIPEALQKSLRYLGFTKEVEGMTPEDAISVLNGWAGVFSGWNHYTKAKVIMELGKLPKKQGDGSYGGTLAEDEKFIYAGLALAGLNSKLEMADYAAQNEQREFNKAWREENESDYKEFSRRLTQGFAMSTGSPEYQERMMNVFHLRYKGDFEKLNWFHQRLAKDMVDNQDTIMNNMFKHGNMPTEKTMDAAIQDYANAAEGMGDDRPQKLLERKRDMLESIKKQMEE